MLTLKQIKENTEAVIERLRKKQFEAREAINEVLNFDEIRRRSQQELDASLSRQKALAKEIGDLMKAGRQGAGREHPLSGGTAQGGKQEP